MLTRRFRVSTKAGQPHMNVPGDKAKVHDFFSLKEVLNDVASCRLYHSLMRGECRTPLETLLGSLASGA